ncbi:ABC transporter ATP-binding protein [Mesomycoplasma moatsii]|uniref:ABC transporter ATP-binding protein n=1 Tax=Mesomycoplasma moatsii TaxID=171287 RepID=UPI0003B673D2
MSKKDNFKETIKIIKFFKEDPLILIFHIFVGFLCSALVIVSSYFVGETINLATTSINLNTKEFLKILYASLIIISLYTTYWLLNTKLLIWTIKLSYRSGSRIRYAIFTKLLNIPISYIDKSKLGELMSRTTNDVDMMIANMVQVVFGFFTSPIIIFSILVTNFIISPLLSVVALFFILLILLVTGIIAKKSSPNFDEMQKKVGQLNSLNKEYIFNKLPIYVFGKQKDIKNNYYKINNQHKESSYKAEYKIGLVYPSLDILENITYASLIAIGIIFFTFNVPHGGVIKLSWGTITTFVLLNRMLLGEIGFISRFASLYEKLFVCAKRIMEILNEVDDIDQGTKSLDIIKGDIKFENVSFSYIKDKPIIKNFNLNVKAGQTIGIVGPTGSGKSTIMNLLMRFYELDSGKITIDGIDIKEIKKDELRKHISIVLQETNLFNESIYTNISYGHHENIFDKEKIHYAAHQIGSEHFINVLPNSYETIIDDRISISQGEAQLLALTRAYYSPSSIMILDEATSSIDSKTEQDIQIGMNKLMKEKTSFVIAHRLSTIKDADLIVVLKDGEILEQGNHQQLIDKNGFYAKMYTSNLNMSDDE